MTKNTLDERAPSTTRRIFLRPLFRHGRAPGIGHLRLQCRACVATVHRQSSHLAAGSESTFCSAVAALCQLLPLVLPGATSDIKTLHTCMNFANLSIYRSTD